MIGLLLKLTGLFLVCFVAGWKVALGVLLMALGHEVDGHAQQAGKEGKK